MTLVDGPKSTNPHTARSSGRPALRDDERRNSGDEAAVAYPQIRISTALTSDSFLIPFIRGIIDSMEANLEKIHKAFEQKLENSNLTREEREKLEEAKRQIKMAAEKLRALKGLVKALASRVSANGEEASQKLAQIESLIGEISMILGSIDTQAIGLSPQLKRDMGDIQTSLFEIKNAKLKPSILV